MSTHRVTTTKGIERYDVIVGDDTGYGKTVQRRRTIWGYSCECGLDFPMDETWVTSQKDIKAIALSDHAVGAVLTFPRKARA